MTTTTNERGAQCLIGTKDAQGWTMIHGWLAEQFCNYSGTVDALTATAPGDLHSRPA